MTRQMLTDPIKMISTRSATFTVPEEYFFHGEGEEVSIREWFSHGVTTKVFVSTSIGEGKTDVSTTFGSQEFGETGYMGATGNIVVERKTGPIPIYPKVPTIVNILEAMPEIYKWQSMQRHAADQQALQNALNQQKDYYEDLIEDIQKFRRAEFNAVFYGALASGVAIILIAIITRLWG